MPNDMSIQVAMDTYFRGNEWRNALLHFLNGVWSDDYAVTCRPKIIFGQVALRRTPNGDSYVCSGKNTGLRLGPGFTGVVCTKDFHETVRTENAVVIEHTLVRFVRNDDFRTLTLKMSMGALKFVKGAKRSDMTVHGYGLSQVSIIGPTALTESEADALDRMGHARVVKHFER
ncbi:hypothetical protein HQ524_04000 [Candidatus Uhrbacteria bacterium]|nr:hypothetical protein [Candidatus Uhrbacteria bacterium]